MILKRPNGTYLTIRTEEDLAVLVADCLDLGVASIDVETTSTDPLTCNLVGVSITARPGEGLYIPIAHRSKEYQLPLEVVQSYLRTVMTDPTIEKIFFNAVFDMTVLERFGMPVNSPIKDVMIAAWQHDNGRVDGFSLAVVTKRELGFDMQPISDLIGNGKFATTFDNISISSATQYAAADVDMPLRIYQSGKFNYDKGPNQDLLKVIQHLNTMGVRIDLEYIQSMIGVIDPALVKQQDVIDALAGRSLYVNSNQQLSSYLFDELGLKPGRNNKKLKSGYYSVAKSHLEEIEHQHPIVSEIQHYKTVFGMRSHHLHPLLKGIRGDRVKAKFNQMTTTSRMSCGAPNLQNQPIFMIEGHQIRQAFLPDSGCKWVRADYSQVELRVLAHILVKQFNDWRYAEIFLRGGDVHIATASAMYDVSEDRIIKAQRGDGKTMNFRIIYGSGVGGIAYALNTSFQNARQFFEAYLGRYPAVRRWMEWQPDFGDENGYVESPFGFRRYVPKGWRSVQLNTPCQSGAAEIIKQAMIDVFYELKKRGLRTQMLLQVHDELDFSVPDEELEEVVPLIKHLMENAVKLAVPLVVDMEIGPNWGQLSAVTDI